MPVFVRIASAIGQTRRQHDKGRGQKDKRRPYPSRRAGACECLEKRGLEAAREFGMWSARSVRHSAEAGCIDAPRAASSASASTLLPLTISASSRIHIVSSSEKPNLGRGTDHLVMLSINSDIGFVRIPVGRWATIDLWIGGEVQPRATMSLLGRAHEFHEKFCITHPRGLAVDQPGKRAGVMIGVLR